MSEETIEYESFEPDVDDEYYEQLCYIAYIKMFGGTHADH